MEFEALASVNSCDCNYLSLAYKELFWRHIVLSRVAFLIYSCFLATEFTEDTEAAKLIGHSVRSVSSVVKYTRRYSKEF
jgi:hypothetical protein